MDAQRTLQTEWLGLISDGARTRVMLANQLGNELPRPIIVVVGFWLMMLFLGFGLLARMNLISVLALLVGAISVGGAIFLLLELNREHGKTILMVTLDPRAAERATRQLHLDKGVLQAEVR